MSDQVHNYRKWERIPLDVPMFVQGKDSDGQKFSDLTVARNIGGGGLLFVSHRSFAPSARVTLQIPSTPWLKKLGGPRGPQVLKGRIIRTIPTESLNFYALQFDRPLISQPAQAKIAGHVRKEQILQASRRPVKRWEAD